MTHTSSLLSSTSSPTPTPIAAKSSPTPTPTPTPIAAKSSPTPTPTPTPIAAKSSPTPTPTPIAAKSSPAFTADRWPSDSSVAHAQNAYSTQPPSLLNLSGKKVYLACGKTDMRKSINGLSEIVVSTFNLDLFGGALFVFCNGYRNRLKILVWDGDGFWLLFKRLEKGRFRWPAAHSEATMTLTAEELSILLGGARVELKLRRNEVFGRKLY